MQRFGKTRVYNLNRMIPASLIAILLMIPLILGISAAESGSTEEGTTESHFAQLKASINDESNWNDQKTTAFAVLALVEAGLEPQAVWLNSNDVQVSLANKSVSNSVSYLYTYISDPSWYQTEAEINIEYFSLILLAIDSSNVDLDLSSALELLKGEQDSTTGSWNYSIYETALATLAVEMLSTPDDQAITSGAAYLTGQELDSYWGSVRDSAVAVLAINGTGIDITTEVKTIVSYQNTTTGSFGTVEDTAWAIIAISSDKTGNSYFYGEHAQAWLKTPTNDSVSGMDSGFDQLELALSTLGESVSFGDLGDESFYNSSSGGDAPPKSADGEVTSSGSGSEVFDDDQERINEGSGDSSDGDAPGDSLGTPGDTSKSTSGLFSGDNLFWTLIAIAVVLVILGIAFWGLIARVEEGRALDGVRRDIVEYIRHNPGEHFAGIMHEFDMSPSSTTYHLKVLEDTEQVVSHRDNKYKRFYLAGNTISMDIQDNDYKELMAVLKNTTARKIVWYLLEHQGANQKEVSEYLELHASTVNWHANRLVNARIIEKVKNGKEISYTVMNEDSIRTVMAIIEDST